MSEDVGLSMVMVVRNLFYYALTVGYFSNAYPRKVRQNPLLPWQFAMFSLAGAYAVAGVVSVIVLIVRAVS